MGKTGAGDAGTARGSKLLLEAKEGGAGEVLGLGVSPAHFL